MPKQERTFVFRGDRLKEIRVKRGLTQNEIETTLRIGDNQVTRYENGTGEPIPAILKRLAELLNVSADYLLGLVEEPNDHLEETDLTAIERQLIAAHRRGDLKEVVRLAAEEPPPQK